MSGFFGGGGSVAVGSITGLGTGVSTFLATPSSANLASAVTDEVGSGKAVFGTAPALSLAVEAFTAGDTLTTAESGKICTNTGAAGAVTLTLPAATGSGVYFMGYCTVAQNIVFDAAGTDVIQNNASASTAGGTATAGAVGRGIMLVDVSSGVWGVAYTIGAWTMA